MSYELYRRMLYNLYIYGKITYNVYSDMVKKKGKTEADIVAYLEGYDVEIADGKIKRQLDKVRGGHLNGSKGESGACKV